LFMTAWDPYILWDLGFLLSFAATLGLILFATRFQRRFEAMLARLLPLSWAGLVSKPLNESLVVTVCAQLTTMPIILVTFGTLSLVTLLSNVLVLPAQTQVMLWGAAATLGGLVWEPLGRVLGWVAGLFLSYTVWVVETTARMPHAAVNLGRVSPAWIGGWYALLMVGAWWMAQRTERRQAMWQALRRAVVANLPTKLLIGGLGIAVTLVWWAVGTLPDGKLHVTILRVGDGNAVLIETPSGQHVLVDGGPSPSTLLAHLGRRMPFWDRTVELIVLGDPDDGNLSSQISVLERYEVRQLLHAVPKGYRSPAHERWQDVVRENGAIAQVASARAYVDLGDGATMTVLHPTTDESDVEDQPVVLRVDYGPTCVLLAGHAGSEAQEAMLARREHVRCDVLQVGGYGSVAGLTPSFLETVRPELVIVSCGDEGCATASTQAMLAQAQQSGATVVRTDRYGSIDVVSDGVGYEVQVGP
jgi:competence protein ComEC